ncbi:hypothetical protein [Saccharopolyspora phatthalungensis]|uniref:Uncharacterized protein n=1 Tax=Saccharopolyspora phatthalungensis TaxID=664693 RepID=A0A840QK45_9PSEU|nr:hypothetical protein [Saccharopolyspora phatthalungensis]MBB5159719.1 hypothetical protein [Saccharopolyspora phatthalungensis]
MNEALRRLLERLADRLPKRRLAAYRALGEAGESASLLNEICKMLVNRRTEVTPAEKETLTRLLDVVPAGHYDYINNRAQTLAAIQVADQPRVVTNADLNWLNTKSQELLERFAGRLSPHDLDSNRSLSFAGEQAIMLDNLCACLVKDEIRVTSHEQQALAELLNWFRPATVTDLVYIHDRENTLASLNVTEQP